MSPKGPRPSEGYQGRHVAVRDTTTVEESGDREVRPAQGLGNWPLKALRS
jgi:hypothetical protein